jgi:hypothetical protein
MTAPPPSPKTPKWPARSEAAKSRRKALYLARADERRALEERALLRRYEELKGAMKRVGLRIGSIADIAHRLDDPAARFEMLRARVERWDALWSITLRKRETRGKIIIGGAVLAQLAELVMHDQADQAFLDSVIRLLDNRVERVRDRLVIKELLAGEGQIGSALPLRRGGPLNESLEDALAAIGEGLAAFERGPVGGGQYDHAQGDEADLDELVVEKSRRGPELANSGSANLLSTAREPPD